MPTFNSFKCWKWSEDGSRGDVTTVAVSDDTCPACMYVKDHFAIPQDSTAFVGVEAEDGTTKYHEVDCLFRSKMRVELRCDVVDVGDIPKRIQAFEAEEKEAKNDFDGRSLLGAMISGAVNFTLAQQMQNQGMEVVLRRHQKALAEARPALARIVELLDALSDDERNAVVALLEVQKAHPYREHKKFKVPAAEGFKNTAEASFLSAFGVKRGHTSEAVDQAKGRAKKGDR